MTTDTEKLEQIIEMLDRQYPQVPEHTRESFARYLALGIQPGSFLRAVIRNDLRAAVYCADPHNYAALRHVIGMAHSVSAEEFA
jgi:hypothetical protein